MPDLAPDIVRQRILIEGYYTVPIDQVVIRMFLRHITAGLGPPTTYRSCSLPAGRARAENEGYDAFVPLIGSGISLRVWTGHRSRRRSFSSLHWATWLVAVCFSSQSAVGGAPPNGTGLRR